MRISVAGTIKDVKLTFTTTEYNCSVKLVGRLVTTVDDKAGWTAYPELVQALNDPSSKRDIIREFATYCITHSTYKMLKETSPYFPGDTGRYLPNYLLYADSIILSNNIPWYSCFKALIREFQDNPEHGFRVFELPMYSNNTYSGSFWPSKVWGIVPPAMVPRLLTEGIFTRNSPHNEQLQRIIREGRGGYPEKDIKYLEKLAS